MDDVLLWALVAVGLLVTEVLTLSLVAGMFGVGALVALGLAVGGLDLPVQLLAFAGTSVLLLAVVRPVAQRHLSSGPALANSPDTALVGQVAVVVQEVSVAGGQVRVHGELWSARPAVEGDVLPPGARVWIQGVTGATVRVYPVYPEDGPAAAPRALPPPEPPPPA